MVSGQRVVSDFGEKAFNKERTPLHNPPHGGGFKYNPPHGGPADGMVTDWIEAKANAVLEAALQGVKRIPIEKALRAPTTHRYDYLSAYITDLVNVLDMDAIRGAKIDLGVDPLGGAGVHYWGPIAERYGLNLTVVNEAVDPTFRFMTVDWDGQIRMDPSSPYAMESLIGLKDRFDIAFACDTDHDRHSIVSRVVVRVIRTDEELMIARSVCRALGLGMASDKNKSDQVAQYVSSSGPLSAGGVPPL